MRKPQCDISFFKERRDQLAQLIPNSAMILVSHPKQIRNNDVHHDYRQDSNFYYLTGFEEPESVFVFIPGAKEESILFVREKDIERETWDGFRYGPEGAKEEFGVDAAYDISCFEEMAPKLLADIDKLYYRFFYFKEADAHIEKAILDVKRLRRRSGAGNLTIEDSHQLLGEKRIIKSSFEVEQMKIAADINSHAHKEVMKAIGDGVNERALYGVFLKAIMEKGGLREAYNGIFASGNSATTLHYVFNDQVCKDGDLFLIDAGPEFNYYASDVTRTYPVNGKFNNDQKRIYDRLLSLQKNIISKVKPGVTMQDLQKETTSELVDLMLEEKIVKGTKDKIITDGDHLKYYPHGIGHWLGLDVHDAGLSLIAGEPRPLASGMALTIEPGLYIPDDDTTVPEALRGMGIRIEDNLIVTDDGSENITQAIPKEVAELEEIISS